MSTNKAFWRVWLEGSRSHKEAKGAEAAPDPLEEGLADLTWSDEESAKKVKTEETFGEEIGNATTHGVMALFMLFILPYAAVHAYLSARSGNAVLDTVAVSIFCIGTFLMFLMSTIDHTMMHGTKQKEVFNRLDHIMIFYAIAGAYTPICLTWLYDSVGRWLLAAIWALAVGGVILKLAWITCPKWLSSGIYILMGWLCLFALGPLLSALPAGAFGWLLAGGLFYSAGAVIYALHPKKFDAKHIYFGSHEIFHVLIMLGTFCHYMVMFHYTAFIA